MRYQQKAGRFVLYGGLALFFIANCAYFFLNEKNAYYFKAQSINYFVNSLYLSGVSGIFPTFRPSLLTKLPKVIFEGRFPAIKDKLQIDIKFRHLKSIGKEREAAITKGVLRQHEFYPAKITINDQEHSADIRLKGDLGAHWIPPTKWSYRVRLKDDASFKGITTFSIQRPSTRQFPHDHLFQYLMRKVGNLAPRHEFVRTVMNGENWGIMNIEENASKDFLEAMGRKEGPIVKFGTQDGWYYNSANTRLLNVPTSEATNLLPLELFNTVELGLYREGSYVTNEEMIRLYSQAVNSVRHYKLKQYEFDQVFNVDAYSKAFITAVAWGNLHSLANSNTRHYFNPYTLKFEPITTDQAFMSTSSAAKLDAYPNLYIELLETPEFAKNFEKNFKIVEASLDEVFVENDRLRSFFPLDYEELDLSVLSKNLQQLHMSGITELQEVAKDQWDIQKLQKLNIKQSLSLVNYNDYSFKIEELDFPEHIFAEYFSDGILALYNLTDFPVKVVGISALCENIEECVETTFLLDEQLTLAANRQNDLPVATFVKMEDLQWSQNSYLKIETELFAKQITFKVRLALQSSPENPFINIQKLNSENTLDFISFTDNDIHIAQGNWTVEEPLIIPKGYSLNIEAGTTLNFATTAYILSEGPINALGTLEKPIKLSPLEDSWQGIHVINVSALSTFENVVMEGSNELHAGSLGLTGGLTFYQSAVKLKNIEIINSAAEDGLNIVRSNFDIANLAITDGFSDGFDADYSTGTIVNSTFSNLGGDGLDTSGSIINGSNLHFSKLGDKAISSGEASQLNFSDITATDVLAGIVSKDGSTTIVSNISMKNVGLYAAMAYIKKPVYGGASLSITQSNLSAADVLNQSNNSLTLEGIEISGSELDVDELYRVGPMARN
jgi:hypothetical protein